MTVSLLDLPVEILTIIVEMICASASRKTIICLGKAHDEFKALIEYEQSKEIHLNWPGESGDTVEKFRDLRERNLARAVRCIRLGRYFASEGWPIVGTMWAALCQHLPMFVGLRDIHAPANHYLPSLLVALRDRPTVRLHITMETINAPFPVQMLLRCRNLYEFEMISNSNSIGFYEFRDSLRFLERVLDSAPNIHSVKFCMHLSAEAIRQSSQMQSTDYSSGGGGSSSSSSSSSNGSKAAPDTMAIYAYAGHPMPGAVDLPPSVALCSENGQGSNRSSLPVSLTCIDWSRLRTLSVDDARTPRRIIKLLTGLEKFRFYDWGRFTVSEQYEQRRELMTFFEKLSHPLDGLRLPRFQTMPRQHMSRHSNTLQILCFETCHPMGHVSSANCAWLCRTFPNLTELCIQLDWGGKWPKDTLRSLASLRKLKDLKIITSLASDTMFTLYSAQQAYHDLSRLSPGAGIKLLSIICCLQHATIPSKTINIELNFEPRERDDAPSGSLHFNSPQLNRAKLETLKKQIYGKDPAKIPLSTVVGYFGGYLH